MSLDDYAEHIYQKHRLCVALAILKTKPAELNTIQYIELLKSNMADNTNDFDDDITICSEDFMIDGDDISGTILEEFDDERFGDVFDRGDGALNDMSQERNDDEQDNIKLLENLSEITYYQTCDSQKQLNTVNDHTYCDSGVNINPQSHVQDVISKTVENPNNLTDKELNFKLNTDLTSIDPNIDTQKTILYTVPAFTQNYTHYSPSQNEEFVIPQHYLYGESSKILANSNVYHKYNETASVNNDNMRNNNNTIDNNNQKEGFAANVIKDNVLEGVSNNNTSGNRLESQGIVNYQDINLFSQITNDEFSQNQFHNDFNNSESILRFQDDIVMTSNNDKNETIPNNSQNMFDYFTEFHNVGNRFNDINNDDKIIEQPKDTKEACELTQNTADTTEINFDSQATNIATTNNKSKEHFKNIQNSEILTQDFGPNHDSSQPTNKDIVQYEIIEEESDATEVIPYKVLEELNKIKMFIRRRDRASCDGYSTDSGYRSDTQKSSNRSALQSSSSAINQSAYCLLNHIMQCPLVASTRQITSEIAETLGQLIDRLHDEETYPPFLEELLDSVDILIRQVYKGLSWENNQFLKKDEFIQRILLLNTSIHIQKHAIDKITNFLNTFHEKVTNNDVIYELENIDEVENVSYLFHILEFLLKKYIKNKEISSQSSQMSQEEDRILKRSSITDIWRKKWNPNFKQNSEGSRENRCVLKECSEILNKIIVSCVNSYSLVAFSALKCFNSMQT